MQSAFHRTRPIVIGLSLILAFVLLCVAAWPVVWEVLGGNCNSTNRSRIDAVARQMKQDFPDANLTTASGDCEWGSSYSFGMVGVSRVELVSRYDCQSNRWDDFECRISGVDVLLGVDPKGRWSVGLLHPWYAWPYS